MKSGLHFLLAAKRCEIAELRQLALTAALIAAVSFAFNERVLTRRVMRSPLVKVLLSGVVFAGAVFTQLNGFAGFVLFLIWPGISLVNKLTPLPREEAAPQETTGGAVSP